MNTDLRHARYLIKFNSRYITTPSGCWNWIGWKDLLGYGRFWFLGNSRFAHRVSYILFVGPIPEGLFILHSCDNPSCVNPAHLRAGTPQDNMDDAYTRGRKNDRGSANGSSKLTESQVEEIRKAYPQETQAQIALRFGVCQAHISDIIRRRRGAWKHVR